jgi:hypothetical protein
MGRASEAVAEGVAIASAAARLTVRNQIIVQTIAAGGTYDPAVFAASARDTLLALAEEQENAAEQARIARRRAWGRFSTSEGTHDYRERDTRNLRKRRNQYLGVAQALREWADDPVRLAALVQTARDAAWSDVEDNLQRRLAVEGETFDSDPDYAKMRKARMDALRMVDLARLAARTRSRRAAGASDDDEDEDDLDG